MLKASSEENDQLKAQVEVLKEKLEKAETQSYHDSTQLKYL